MDMSYGCSCYASIYMDGRVGISRRIDINWSHLVDEIMGHPSLAEFCIYSVEALLCYNFDRV